MLLSFILLIIVWFCVEGVYFRIARQFAIIDKPNARSSHQVETIRGGGIIFPLAIIAGIWNEKPDQWMLIISVALIAILSFIDDIRNVPSKVRLILQSCSVAGLLYLFSCNYSMTLLIILFVTILGVINAHNFMDGINGITVLYSIVILVSMYWVQENLVDFLSTTLFVTLFSALTVFGFLNLRKKALCFSGDVGSVSLALIFCYLLLKLSITTNFDWWILFLGIYGIDTVGTIICRFFRKESLLKAHRSHFYQYLVNEAGWTHIQVSILYALSQLVLNVFVVYSYISDQIWAALTSLFVFLSIYIIFRLRLEGSRRLFVSYNP